MTTCTMHILTRSARPLAQYSPTWCTKSPADWACPERCGRINEKRETGDERGEGDVVDQPVWKNVN